MLRRITTPLLLLVTLSLSACIDDPVFPDQPLRVTQVNLPPLMADGCYELWLSYPPEFALVDSNGAPLADYLSAGRFRVTASGAIESVTGGPATFRLPAGYNPSLLGVGLITVERLDAPSTRPGAVLLAGRFSRFVSPATATLTLMDSLAFGAFFGAVDSVSPVRRRGLFFLDTPSSPDTSDWMRGLWFSRFDLRDSLVAGLTLPAQPSNARNPGWRYGAWIVPHAPGAPPISLGSFDTPNDPDSDLAGPHAGPQPGYPFPGGDLVTHPSVSDLRGAYGVLVDLQPRAFALPAPLLPVLALDTIPSTARPSASVQMVIPLDLPIVEVAIVP